MWYRLHIHILMFMICVCTQQSANNNSNNSVKREVSEWKAATYDELNKAKKYAHKKAMGTQNNN